MSPWLCAFRGALQLATELNCVCLLQAEPGSCTYPKDTSDTQDAARMAIGGRQSCGCLPLRPSNHILLLPPNPLMVPGVATLLPV